MSSSLQKNKQTAMDFYAVAFNDCNPAEAIERFVGKEYIQHNPLVADGKQAFIDYFTEMADKWPGKEVHFVRAVAEGNHVALHTHQEWPGDSDYVTMDIFRFDEEGKIVEHWDAVQIIPESSKNGNSMF